MNRATALCLSLTALVLLGCETSRAAAPATAAPLPDVELALSGEISFVPVDETPCRGPADALVTVVEFTDFECGHCARAQEILRVLEERHADLRVCYKHRTIPLHFYSRDAAEAAEAARIQGKFWEMHDLLFANQHALGPSDLDGYARVLGLELERFHRDRMSEAAFTRVDRDEVLAAELEVKSTPTFFINGRRIKGARPLEVFERYVQEARADAEQAMARGVPREQVYAAIISSGRAQPAAEVGETHLAVVEVPIAPGDPCRGPADAPVTLIEFTDFECPYCGMAKQTVDRLEERYGERLRVCIKLNPLTYHRHGESTARYALAAARQGHFFTMYDDLFEHQGALDDISVFLRARALEIDVERMQADAASAEVSRQLARHRDEAKRAKLRGTPCFLVNSEVILGAQPYEVFEAAVERQLAVAGTR
jgi:protein-disulfide isomerase